jgi:hypothetical protein
VLAILAAAGGGIATALIVRGNTDAANPTAREQSSVEDDGRLATDRASEDAAADSPTDDTTTSGAAASRLITGPGYELTAPRGSDWVIGPPESGNEGRLLTRLLTGPGGAVIRIVHTPGSEAEPDPATVVSREPFAAPARDAQRFTVEDFPTAECGDRLCDDFVLNDPVFGGIAILANGTGMEGAAAAAEQIALSVVVDP